MQAVLAACIYDEMRPRRAANLADLQRAFSFRGGFRAKTLIWKNLSVILICFMRKY